MVNQPARYGTTWTSADNEQLDKLIRQNTPTRLIARELERTESGVRSHVSRIKRSLKPVNQSPYGTKSS